MDRIMTKIYLIILFILVFSITASNIFAQACSCGGTPLLSSLEQTVTPVGSWQFSLTYEYNSINDLVTETTEFEDNTRNRFVHSGLLEIGYGLSKRVSLSAVFSLLQQERETNSSEGPGDYLRTRGIGDGLFLVKYNVIPFNVFAMRQLALGVGIKYPLGNSSLLNNNSLIAADMQLGTGSWDLVLWGYFYQSYFKKFPISLYANLSYRLNSSNNRFGVDSPGYRFGNEFITEVGINYQPESFFHYSVGLNYRSTQTDEFDSNGVPNTGGKWIDLTGGLNANLTRSTALRFSGDIPIYRSLSGAQLTTSYSLSVSLFYTIAGKSS
jgi:hypothetical protein